MRRAADAVTFAAACGPARGEVALIAEVKESLAFGGRHLPGLRSGPHRPRNTRQPAPLAFRCSPTKNSFKDRWIT